MSRRVTMDSSDLTPEQHAKVWSVFTALTKLAHLENERDRFEAQRAAAVEELDRQSDEMKARESSAWQAYVSAAEQVPREMRDLVDERIRYEHTA